MALTFTDLKAEVASRVRLSVSATEQNTLLERWINQSILDIHAREDWPWLLEREIVQTVAEKDDGTIAVSVGGTTVTGTSTAFAAADVGKFIQTSDSEDWYKITAVASATSLTLEAAYTGSTALTAGTYIIRKIFYTTSSSAEKILTIKQARSPQKVWLIHYREWALKKPGLGDCTGKAEVYVIYGQDSSGNIRFSVYPHADEIYNLEVLYKTRNIGTNAAGTALTTLSTGTDVPLIPGRYREVIINGALMRAYEYIRSDAGDRRPEMKAAVFERGIDQMKADATRTSDRHIIIQNREGRLAPQGPKLPEDFDYRYR